MPDEKNPDEWTPEFLYPNTIGGYSRSRSRQPRRREHSREEGLWVELYDNKVTEESEFGHEVTVGFKDPELYATVLILGGKRYSTPVTEEVKEQLFELFRALMDGAPLDDPEVYKEALERTQYNSSYAQPLITKMLPTEEATALAKTMLEF